MPEFEYISLKISTTALVLCASIASADDSAPRVAPMQSVRSGVFSIVQAARGERQYRANCSDGCHMAELTGNGLAPPLASASFLQHWQGLTLNDLFIKIRMSMPFNAPQSLSDPTYIDIVAFLLDSNGIPAGARDLTADPLVLKSITL